MRFLIILVALLALSSSAQASPARRPLVLALGDSLTAGYGLEPGLGFAPQLQATLRRRGIPATVVDAGVSGDTTAGGLARLGWTLDGLPATPDLVIVELGANDMLRGLDPALIRANLDAILAELGRRNIPVLLSGMRAAPNLDPAYRARFEAIFPALAASRGARLDPFFLTGVAGNRALVQPDGLHPTYEGVKAMALRLAGPVAAALQR